MSCREFCDRNLEKCPFPAWLRFCDVVTCQQESRISYFRKSSRNFETFPVSLFKPNEQFFRGKSFKNSNLSSQIPLRRFIPVGDWCRIRSNPTFQNCLLSLRPLRCQFHQRFTCSFYACRSRKIDNLTVFFTLLGSVHVKALFRMLMKLSQGANPLSH